MSAQPVSWRRILLDFGRIGVTSFGGGTATLLSMRQLCVHKRAWLTDAEYTDTFVMSRLSPGINILAQVILIGRRLAGWKGASAGVFGLMLPAVAITLALCVGYEAVHQLPEAAGALLGISAAVAGLTIVLCLEIGRGVVAKHSWVRDLCLLVVFVSAALAGLHPVIVILGSAAIGAALPQLLRSGPRPGEGSNAS